MNLAPVRTRIKLDDIALRVFVSGDEFPTYLWTVFFKVDGDTVSVDQNGKPQGKATVVGTPGDHGDLGASGSVPPATGQFLTVVSAIPIPSRGVSIPGMVGCVAILLAQSNTPDDAVAAGHQALNSALQQGLDNFISTLGPMKTSVTPADIKNIQDQAQIAVINAVTNHLSLWEKISIGLGIDTPDKPWGSVPYIFSQDQLTGAPLKGIPLQNTIAVHGGLFKGDTSNKGPIIFSWTFNGKVIADPLPLSMKRILQGIGHPPPIGILEAMGGDPVRSVKSWIAAVR